MSSVLLKEPPKNRPALRLVSTTTLSRDAWLDLRKGGIGSSDAAAAVGLNPYQSQLELWMVKTGRDALLKPIDPQDDTQAVYWGTLLEPIVASAYSKRTGHRVRKVNAVLQHPHPDYPWMLANIDREVVGVPDVSILECKTAGLNGARNWRDGVPQYVQLQVQHQLAVTGKAAADVAVLICGQALEVYRIARDEVLIARLIALEAQFWEYVVNDVAPPADGSDSADTALRALYPRDCGAALDWSQDLEMAAVFSDLQALRSTLAQNVALESQLKQRIQERMGDASKAVFENGEVSWKRSKDGTSLDTAALLKDYPELGAKYTTAKSGSRRFLVS